MPGAPTIEAGAKDRLVQEPDALMQVTETTLLKDNDAMVKEGHRHAIKQEMYKKTSLGWWEPRWVTKGSLSQVLADGWLYPQQVSEDMKMPKMDFAKCPKCGKHIMDFAPHAQASEKFRENDGDVIDLGLKDVPELRVINQLIGHMGLHKSQEATIQILKARALELQRQAS